MTIEQKRQALHFLFVRNHMIYAKQSVLSVYGAERIRDLDEDELDECIERMNRISEQTNDPLKNEIRQWRHKCLRAMSKFMDTSDWNNVNSFMMNRRVAGKHLYELNIDELKTMHRKINAIAHIMKEKKAKNERLAKLN